MSIEDLLLYDGLIGLAGGQVPLVFLLKADFNGPDIPAGSVPASLGAPYVNVGGPLTFIQNDGNFSINSNRLYFTPQTTPATGDLKVYKNGISRTPGVAAFARSLASSAAVQWAGFRDENHTSGGMNVVARTIYITALSHQYVGPTPSGSTYVLNLTDAVQDTEYEFYWVLRKMGAFLFLGTQLALVVDGGTTNPVQAFHESYNSNGYVNTLRVADLPANGYGVFDHRDLDVTASAAMLVTGTAYECTDDTLITWTLPGTLPVTSQAFYWRLPEDGTTYPNAMYLIISQTGTVNVYKRINSSNTLLASIPSGVVGGQTCTIEVRGSSHTMKANGAQVFSVTVTEDELRTGVRLKGYDGANTWANLTARTLDGQYTYPWENPDIAVNGSFDADTGWTKEAGWAISGGVASCSSGSLQIYQSAPTAGKTFRVTFTVKNYVSGQVRFVLGGSTTGTYRSANGTYEQIVTVASGNFIIFQSSSFIGSIDDVSVIEVNPNRSDNNPGYGLATYVLPGPRSAGDLFTHEADCIIEFTLDALPSSGNIDVIVRRTSATQYWFIHIPPTGDFQLWEYDDGVSTNKVNITGVLSGGMRLSLILNDETIKGFYNTTQAFSYSSAAKFKTGTSGSVFGFGTGGRLSNLICWPLNMASAPNTPGAVDALAAFTRMGE